MATPFRKANLNTMVGNGKSFLAYEIIDRLKNSENLDLLRLLRNEVSNSDQKRGKIHQVFKPSYPAAVSLPKRLE
jgi:hypothetical protein